VFAVVKYADEAMCGVYTEPLPLACMVRLSLCQVETNGHRRGLVCF